MFDVHEDQKYRNRNLPLTLHSYVDCTQPCHRASIFDPSLLFAQCHRQIGMYRNVLRFYVVVLFIRKTAKYTGYVSITKIPR